MLRHVLSLENPLKRLASAITLRDVVSSVLCYMLFRASLFGGITPFGMAFYAASFSNTGWFYAFAGALAGALSVHPGLESLGYIITLGFTTGVLGLSDNRSGKVFRALVVSLIYVTVSFFTESAFGFSLYDFIVSAFEGFLCFVGVCAIASVVPVISSYKIRTYLSHSDVIGIISLAAMVIMSLASIPPIFGFGLASCTALFLIMSVSSRGDIMISSSAGIIFGLALSLGGSGSASLVGAYAIIGFASGYFSRYSRLGTVLGITLANAVIVAFMNDSGFMLINPVEVFIVGMTFAALPKKTASVFRDFVKKATSTGCGISAEERASELREERLLDISAAFERLSCIYRKDCYPRKPGKKYTSDLFDYLGEKCCRGCIRYFDCWNKNRKNTLACMGLMLDKAEKKEPVRSEDLPEYFKAGCIKKNELIKSFNSVYDIYKTDKLWLDKMYETRILIANQMKGVSDILAASAGESCLLVDGEGEMNLRSAFDKRGIPLKKADVLLGGDELERVRIVSRKSISRDLLSEVCREVFALDMYLCRHSSSGDEFFYELCPTREYIVDTACVHTPREGEEVCGDSFGFFYVKNKAIMAISDGMGSGARANEQSRSTIEMLRAFCEAGYEGQAVFELINSSLLLRSVKDCFSTIDMMSADMSTGEITFHKIGAAPTYIKNDEGIHRIDCNSLPVGILREVEPETSVIYTREHTTVVMISDGISNSEIKNGESWIEGEIARLDTHNPAVVAEKILEKALSKNGGRAEDDMTVAVAVVYKNEYKGKKYIY